MRSDNTASGLLYRMADYLPHLAALALLAIVASGLHLF